MLEHTGVGDAGILAIAKGCPRLHSLSITNHSATSFSRLPLPAVAAAAAAVEGGVAAGGGRGQGISDAALMHVADHCGELRQLVIQGGCKGSASFFGGALGRILFWQMMFWHLDSCFVVLCNAFGESRWVRKGFGWKASKWLSCSRQKLS